MKFFRWIVERARKPPAWVVLGRDDKCAQCQVARQAHTRERHPFKEKPPIRS